MSTLPLKTLVIFCVVCLSKCQFQNNVCPTIIDYFSMQNNSNCWYNFAAESRAPDIIKKTGYPFQEFKVQTKDGYILTVFRIPSVNTGKEPVFLMHGVQSTSGIFVGIGKDSLAFLLADAGYDVWLGNYRGTEYSEGHVRLNTSQKEYWDYGVDEISLIDVPAMLNLVEYHARRKKSIIYIGHSLGTTAALMYSSEYPDRAKNLIKLFVFLAPAYKLTHIPSPIRMLFPLLRPALTISNSLNVVQIFSQGHARRLTRPTCLASPTLMLACLTALNIYLGPFTQIAPEILPVYFNQLPGGTSVKTLVYITEAAKGNFAKYNYGRGKNMILYGSPDPPEYNVSRIKVPIMMYYSQSDWATPKTDALLLYKALPKNIRFGSYDVPIRNFNHFDFLFGRNVKKIVYDHLLAILRKVSSVDRLIIKTN